MPYTGGKDSIRLNIFLERKEEQDEKVCDFGGFSFYC